MPAGEPTDVTSSLTDLERKLVDLERELSAVAGGTAAVATRVPSIAGPSTPAETRTATLRVEDLRGEIADLVRFRDQLEAAARELVTEYDRLVERLRSGAPAAGPGPLAPAASPGRIGPAADAAPAATPAPAPTPVETAPAPGPPAYDLPPAVAAGIPGYQPPSGAPAGPEPGDDTSFVGAVVVDAGPFTDITTLQTFEQSLARVEGAEDVYVRSFEGNRALIDVRLSNPVPLVQLLRNQLPWSIKAGEAGEGRLTVDLVADSHGT